MHFKWLYLPKSPHNLSQGRPTATSTSLDLAQNTLHCGPKSDGLPGPTGMLPIITTQPPHLVRTANVYQRFSFKLGPSYMRSALGVEMG
jgi:hypothetical protein